MPHDLVKDATERLRTQKVHFGSREFVGWKAHRQSQGISRCFVAHGQ
jgi:hypothetical protein